MGYVMAYPTIVVDVPPASRQLVSSAFQCTHSVLKFIPQFPDVSFGKAFIDGQTSACAGHPALWFRPVNR